ncbi:MAG TPA: cupin domain-containing protein [Anaerolineales bacterium]|jgi:quercetin dioxygenase-like cupin family protein|nr:cupin domain-containing protein [Anaerolineales bacterium]
MKIIEIEAMKPPNSEAATFQGFEHGANVSFFIVQFFPGKGPKKHRHPYEETFIILDGEIEAIVDGDTQLLGNNMIAIVPAGTWHEFKNRSEKPARLVNIHPVPKMITEWA